LAPAPRLDPTQWTRANRKYPASAARPGPRDPAYTPYVIPYTASIEDPRYETSVFVCASQMGKTDGDLDLIGWRCGTRPRPILYVGPSKDFITDQFEPRLMALLDEAPSLSEKVARGKRSKKTRKVVGGVPIRLAWAGSATQLSSDQAGDIHVDELDRMGTDVAHEGDPLTLVKARGFTYRDRKIMVTSTPKRGQVDVIKDDPSGLEFWKAADALESPIWKLWQTGTRHHWAWPCPQCGEFFIPRFACLEIPKIETTQQGAKEKTFRRPTAAEARAGAFLKCPRPDCGGVITESDKAAMNARGVYVAPGQSIAPDGTVTGDPPAGRTISFWVSGLCSPWVSFGERAADFIEAVESGDPEKLQAVVNTGFGELYATAGGDAPEETEVSKKRTQSLYKLGELPDGAVVLVFAADVQKNRIIWVIRGFGARSTSWLIDCGTLWGPTTDEDVWTELAQLITKPVCGLPLRIAFIDSGFRPGRPDDLPLNRIYDFCRRFPRLVWPTKGASRPMRLPLVVSKIEVTTAGKAAKYGLDLVRLDPDHWKSWVHEKVRWPSDQPGAWHLPIDVSDDYCAQIVSEARMRKPSGGASWIRKSRENHFLDCEAMAGAAGYLLGVARITDEQVAAAIAERDIEAKAADAPPRPAPEPGENYWTSRRGGGGWWDR
jgi:phage terminase large subunit GpA-like protein